jgi:DNA-binding NarL/FixJ family response regulator
MRTSYATGTRAESPRLVIIDSKKLRQAGIMQLLDALSNADELTLSAVASDNPIEKHRMNASREIVILSVGSASIEDCQQQTLIKSVRTLMPRAPVVVISDREEPKEVCAAFEAGAAGFMPTSIEPSVALQALSFIRCGGSFFPPSTLSNLCSAPEMPTVRTQVVVNASDRADNWLPEGSSKLSAKQEEVFRLLRRGQPNKVIARQLGVSEATVKVHVRCIMRKLGVVNRTQVAVAAMSRRFRRRAGVKREHERDVRRGKIGKVSADASAGPPQGESAAATNDA